jgi:hypothetical protein
MFVFKYICDNFQNSRKKLQATKNYIFRHPASPKGPEGMPLARYLVSGIQHPVSDKFIVVF